ncbi:MAG: hypothetical protein OXN17_20860 [Candidatus Poribacteria bacterium]|nr:hypothetical protein [Candidatus Poribacteria bacterium]MDE0506546.1 hypothetical protein [Candidatus Poribacteria bacterium]
MDTSTVAIIVSFISAGIAGSTLGWNIYRDVGLNPRISVRFNVVFLPAYTKGLKYLSISGSNRGLVPTTVNGINIKEQSLLRWILKKTRYAAVNPDFENPLSHKLPQKLEGGDEVQLYLPCDENCFLNESWSHVGLQTSFGKTYWAKPRDVDRARKLWLEDFGHGET